MTCNSNSAMFEDFLVNKLKLPNWKETLAESKWKCLQQVFDAFELYVNFQNLTWCAMPLSERKIPTEEETIDFIYNQGIGGCCIHNNWAFKVLLDFLGYDNYMVAVFNPVWTHGLHSHVLIIVKLKSESQSESKQDQAQEEMYAIDVGFSRRIPYIIPLHNLPHRDKVGGWEFEFRKNEETGNYERVFYQGCPVYGKFKDSEGGQRLDYHFNLIPRSFDYFLPTWDQVFVDPDSKFIMMPFLNRLLRFENPWDYDYVTVLKRAIVTGTRDESQRKLYDTYKEMKGDILKYFPTLDPVMVKAALDKFDEYERQGRILS